MTISTDSIVAGPYTGNGSASVYAFAFKVFADTDVLVKHTTTAGVDSTLALSTGYSVSRNADQDANPGGTITYKVASVTTNLPAGEKLTITAQVPVTQLTALPSGGNYAAKTVERMVDKVTMLVKQIWRDVSRAIRQPVTDGTAMGELPNAATRANKWLSFDSSGNPTVTDAQSASGTSVTATSSTTARMLADRFAEVRNVKDFGAVGDGSTDDTAAIQAAINSLATGKGVVFFPPGTYKVTSTITVAQDRIHLRGAARWASSILFIPGANDTCIEFTKGASVLYQCSLSDLTFTSSDVTYVKTAVNIIDVSAFTMKDVVVGPLWNDATGSIGLQVNGREASVIERVELYTDRPIVIGGNPNDTIDIDHFIFRDIYIICASATAHKCIEVLTGVNLSNVTFDGYQAWVKGGHGFYWVDTTTVASSLRLTIKNARWEGTANATGNLIRIEHNSNLQGLRIENVYGGLNALGIKLRKVIGATIADSCTLNTSGLALDVDSTVDALTIINLFIQSSGTVSIGTLRRLYDAGPGAMASNSLAFAVFGRQSSVSAARVDVPLMGTGQSIAQDAAASIGVAVNTQGFLFVVTDEDVSAIYALNGGLNTVNEITDTAGLFAAAKDTATSYNIYYEAPDYKIQNKRTGAHTVRWLLIGDFI